MALRRDLPGENLKLTGARPESIHTAIQRSFSDTNGENQTTSGIGWAKVGSG